MSSNNDLSLDSLKRFADDLWTCITQHNIVPLQSRCQQAQLRIDASISSNDHTQIAMHKELVLNVATAVHTSLRDYLSFLMDHMKSPYDDTGKLQAIYESDANVLLKDLINVVRGMVGHVWYVEKQKGFLHFLQGQSFLDNQQHQHQHQQQQQYGNFINHVANYKWDNNALQVQYNIDQDYDLQLEQLLPNAQLPVYIQLQPWEFLDDFDELILPAFPTTIPEDAIQVLENAFGDIANTIFFDIFRPLLDRYLESVHSNSSNKLLLQQIMHELANFTFWISRDYREGRPSNDYEILTWLKSATATTTTANTFDVKKHVQFTIMSRLKGEKYCEFMTNYLDCDFKQQFVDLQDRGGDNNSYIQLLSADHRELLTFTRPFSDTLVNNPQWDSTTRELFARHTSLTSEARELYWKWQEANGLRLHAVWLFHHWFVLGVRDMVLYHRKLKLCSDIETINTVLTTRNIDVAEKWPTIDTNSLFNTIMSKKRYCAKNHFF